MQKPDDAAAQLAAADAWWELAEKPQNKANRAQYASRAKAWYEQALPQLAGLNKTKAEKRLADIGAIAGVASSKPAAAAEIAGCQGRFFVSVDDYVILYVNQQKVFEGRDENKSKELFLKDGDVVVAQVQPNKRNTYRLFVAFQSSDERWELATAASDWHEMKGTLATLIPTAVAAGKDKMSGAKPKSTTREMEKLTLLGLKELQCEQVQGKSEKLQIALVVKGAMFKPTKPVHLADPLKHPRP
jgi:hypothetical protein